MRAVEDFLLGHSACAEDFVHLLDPREAGPAGLDRENVVPLAALDKQPAWSAPSSSQRRRFSERPRAC
jgi:hypothetical protein